MILSKNSLFSIFTLLLMPAIFLGCHLKKTQPVKQIAETTTSINVNKTIVLGDISHNPRKKIRKFQPLADYLAANLSQFDLGTVKIAPDMETMIAWLESGEVDIYIDSPYPAMLAMDRANAKPILRRWKKGNAEYSSLIFTLGDPNIKSLADLQGKIIAFDHPASTTGYMLPLAKLLESKLTPQEITSLENPVSPTSVGYIFTYEDESSIELLLSQKVAAAAIDHPTFEQLPPEIKQKAIVLAETEKVARNLVLVAEDLSSAEIDAISEVLLFMDRTETGKSILAKFAQTTKFDNFSSQPTLERMEKLYQQTKKQ